MSLTGDDSVFACRQWSELINEPIVTLGQGPSRNIVSALKPSVHTYVRPVVGGQHVVPNRLQTDLQTLQ